MEGFRLAGTLEATGLIPAQVGLPSKAAQGLILSVLQVSRARDRTALLGPWPTISTPCTVKGGLLLSSWCEDPACPTRVAPRTGVGTVGYWPALTAVPRITDLEHFCRFLPLLGNHVPRKEVASDSEMPELLA